MPKYLIERESPGAGELPPEQLKAISQKSCSVLTCVIDPTTGSSILAVYSRSAIDEALMREESTEMSR